jgi:hypothetical protein
MDTFSIRYEDTVNGVKESNCCLFCKSDEPFQYTVRENSGFTNIKMVVGLPVVTVMLPKTSCVGLPQSLYNYVRCEVFTALNIKLLLTLFLAR